jgi:hypothetical protein
MKKEYCVYWNEQRNQLHYMKTDRALKYHPNNIITKGITKDDAINRLAGVNGGKEKAGTTRFN